MQARRLAPDAASLSVHLWSMGVSGPKKGIRGIRAEAARQGITALAVLYAATLRGKRAIVQRLESIAGAELMLLNTKRRAAKLTGRQGRFARYYVQHMNGTRAA